MPTTLENAMADAATIKAAYAADLVAIAKIEADVQNAGLPLASAQTQAQNRRAALNACMDALAAAAVASKV
jgi:hypothetical protein